METLRIFVIDDERIIRVSIADDLRDAGYKVFEFTDALAALVKISNNNADVIITDIKMPHLDGIEFLKKVKHTNPEVYVVVMTAYGSIDSAVEAMKFGAYDYINKPFNTEEIILILDRIKELKTVKEDIKQLRSQIQSKYDYSSFIASIAEIEEITGLIKTVADTSTTVLIIGETGTGKELLTNIIHHNSIRKLQPLIKVSCAILSREILESELFGHVKGAFTGAGTDKKGRFELADKGTLYLDDVDDIPYDLQVKLLRVLGEHEFERVGSAETIKVDVKVIASTKNDLRKLVEKGEFREDLYYRLNVFPIHLKPLREKRKDIPLLVNYYVNKFSQGRNIRVDEEIYNILNRYHWNGNVRELKNLMERLVLLANDDFINSSLVPVEIRCPSDESICTSIGKKTLDEILSEIEINTILKALEKCKNNKTRTAELLGLPTSTLRTRINKYNIE